MSRTERAASGGFTLLEVMIGVALFMVVAGTIFGFLGVSQTALVESSSQADMENTARRVLNRISEDFRAGIMATLTPWAAAGSSSASVAPASGYANGAVTQGPAISYQFRQDPADPANGRDDDGDGYVDEGSVVRTLSGVETTIAGNVKTLSFTLSGNNLISSITLERMVRGRRTFTFTDSLQIRFRN